MRTSLGEGDGELSRVQAPGVVQRRQVAVQAGEVLCKSGLDDEGVPAGVHPIEALLGAAHQGARVAEHPVVHSHSDRVPRAAQMEEGRARPVGAVGDDPGSWEGRLVMRSADQFASVEFICGDEVLEGAEGAGVVAADNGRQLVLEERFGEVDELPSGVGDGEVGDGEVGFLFGG